MDLTSYYVSASSSDAALDPELLADGEVYEMTEIPQIELELMQTVVNQLVVTDLLLALIVGCICAAIFSRYIRG